MREQVALYGLNVECLLCGYSCKHFPESQGRLRHRPCDNCKRHALRSSYWVSRHPGEAEKLRREAKTERVLL